MATETDQTQEVEETKDVEIVETIIFKYDPSEELLTIHAHPVPQELLTFRSGEREVGLKEEKGQLKLVYRNCTEQEGAEVVKDACRRITSKRITSKY